MVFWTSLIPSLNARERDALLAAPRRGHVPRKKRPPNMTILYQVGRPIVPIPALGAKLVICYLHLLHITGQSLIIEWRHDAAGSAKPAHPATGEGPRPLGGGLTVPEVSAARKVLPCPGRETLSVPEAGHPA